MFKALKDVLPGMIDELGISEPLMRSAVFPRGVPSLRASRPMPVTPVRSASSRAH